MDVLQIDQASQAFPISSYVQVGRSPARCRHRTGRGCPRPGGGPGRGGVLSNQGGLAGVLASGCTDIEAGTVGAVIDQLDRFIPGEALGAVAGHRVGKLRMLPGVLGVQGHRSTPVEADQEEMGFTAGTSPRLRPTTALSCSAGQSVSTDPS